MLDGVHSLTALLEPLVDEGSLRCHYLGNLEEGTGAGDSERLKRKGVGCETWSDAVHAGGVVWCAVM